MIVIADETKLVPRLGKYPCRWRWWSSATRRSRRVWARRIAALGYENVRDELAPEGRRGVSISDSGNLIYDCPIGAIQNAAKLAAAIRTVPGVVEHGLFMGIATTLIIAGRGEVEVIDRT